jgi:hypothetical protein
MAGGKSNLIPGGHKLTLAEQSAGGKASGKARQLKKSFKLALMELLEEEVKDKNGIGTGKTYQEMINMGLVKGAIKGSPYNYRTILETVGELEPEANERAMPTIKLEVVDNSNLEAIMYEEKDKK